VTASPAPRWPANDPRLAGGQDEAVADGTGDSALDEPVPGRLGCVADLFRPPG